MLTTDEASSASGGDDAGTGGGTGAQGGKGSGAYGGSAPTPLGGTTSTGGVSGYGGTGVAGSSGKGGTYGKGGGSYGGTYGKGGSTGKGGSAGYPVADGGAYPYGGVGGSGGSAGRGGYPGKGGTYGKGGFGGSAGWVDGGAAGEAGGGTGAVSFGGSPAVVAACRDACANAPASCSDIPPDDQDCLDECIPLSSAYPTCELELADYVECLAANLAKNAQCMTGTDASCRGPGCTADAEATCRSPAETFTRCQENGSCGIGSGIGTGYCSYEISCPTHDHFTSCSLIDSPSDTWFCTCSIDGTDQFTGYFAGSGQATCQGVANYCNLAR